MLDDDVFDLPLTQTATSPSNKKPKHSNSTIGIVGKENIPPNPNSPFFPNPNPFSQVNSSAFGIDDYEPDEFENCSLDFIPSTFDIDSSTSQHYRASPSTNYSPCSAYRYLKGGYFGNSIESKLVLLRNGSDKPSGTVVVAEGDIASDSDSDSELDPLLKLCDELEQVDGGSSVTCPLCEIDISNLTAEERNLHTNDCLDKSQDPPPQHVALEQVDAHQSVPKLFPVVDWLRNLGLEKYEHVFAREEVDFDTLKWLTEEDLISMGVTALGPRKKIVHALSELRKEVATKDEEHEDAPAELRRIRNQKAKLQHDKSERKVDSTSKPVANKLITEYFPGFATNGKKVSAAPGEQHEVKNSSSDSGRKHKARNTPATRKLRDVPKWCSIPGTTFRVDAFKYLRGDCSHWFLTHFHLDHYQGLTKSFNHGKIYCSSVTARLVNMNIGIPYDKLHVLPLNEKVKIDDVDVTCLDANHCPGSVVMLFEPPNGKTVLHTGDFRFSEEIAHNPLLQTHPIHTLILDTTYCNPQYDFPKQDAVIQFVIDAIQAEAFNPKTLFLIGSYTIGKERLFMEVARALRKKVYVTAAKLRLLKCLEFQEEDMQWFTSNEHESNIHVAPMWTLASFKRLKHISSQYASRFSLIVAFSPTGWTFGKGKKKSPGRRWQQGTIIRYEVPYSEHSSFTELQEFVKLISPDNIIPSVNNDGPESANAMISLLLS